MHLLKARKVPMGLQGCDYVAWGISTKSMSDLEDRLRELQHNGIHHRFFILLLL